MGSRVLVVVANLVMEDIECRALATFHTPPRFWRRYVDDSCTALPCDLVDPFYEHLNSIDPHIQFSGQNFDVPRKTLSSSGVSSVQEEKRIQDLLWRNGYPAVFSMKHTLPQQGQRSEEQAARASVIIPYIHNLSQSICRVLSSLALGHL